MADFPENSVIILGLPRSGTTWISKILDSHPAVVYRHEPDSVKKLRNVPRALDIENSAPYVNTM
jgi:hypothetical protein